VKLFLRILKPIRRLLIFLTILNACDHRRSQGGTKGPWPLQIFRKCSDFVLWEAFF